MIALVLLVVSVGALDSLNPSTLGPALLLAVGEQGRKDVAAFLFGVFAVSTIGGLVLLFGPGRALLAHIAKPTPHTRHLIELIAGAVLTAVAVGLWFARGFVARRLADRTQRARGGSSFLLGAGIMAVELPSAFPYFAALVAIVESGRMIGIEVALVLLFNVAFVAPLLVVLGLVTFGGERGAQLAGKARTWLDRYAPALAPAVLGLVGVVLLVIGGAGLT
jgi:cytochrome c biogenesis protein CcdA